MHKNISTSSSSIYNELFDIETLPPHTYKRFNSKKEQDEFKNRLSKGNIIVYCENRQSPFDFVYMEFPGMQTKIDPYFETLANKQTSTSLPHTPKTQSTNAIDSHTHSDGISSPNNQNKLFDKLSVVIERVFNGKDDFKKHPSIYSNKKEQYTNHFKLKIVQELNKDQILLTEIKTQAPEFMGNFTHHFSSILSTVNINSDQIEIHLKEILKEKKHTTTLKEKELTSNNKRRAQ